mgnify:CR=1 FL=1
MDSKKILNLVTIVMFVITVVLLGLFMFGGRAQRPRGASRRRPRHRASRPRAGRRPVRRRHCPQR